ncbi:AN1-type zinc finger protein TMC1, partial [Fusarium oxysporum f. sp. albedinis]
MEYFRGIHGSHQKGSGRSLVLELFLTCPVCTLLLVFC